MEARGERSATNASHETIRAALPYSGRVNSWLCSILLLLAAACRPPTGPGGLVRPGTPPQVDIVRARERGLAQSFTWEEWGPEAFARAKREGRYLLIDGAAEWCHWCHVMDETTYRDPQVGARQRPIHDPVWGGVYQYSAASDWSSQHYEKLMTFQASNLEAYARAWALTKEASVLTEARALARYMETFLGAPDGTFYTNQDADVGSHDRSIPFVDGHVYYEKDEAGRRALGVPWVDTHVYSRENGLAIAALLVLHEVTGEPEPLARARKAADVLLSSHVREGGTVWREASHRSGSRYLGDAAALGRALALLAQRTGEARYREAALSVGERLLRDFAAPEGGALFESTPDSDAVGVFARRERPFVQNVGAARFLAALHALTGEMAWRDRGREVLAGISMARRIASQGRFVGEYLLAADELGVFPWPALAPKPEGSTGTPQAGLPVPSTR
jgi:uncharacterized protein YyaL (SSP411 family)